MPRDPLELLRKSLSKPRKSLLDYSSADALSTFSLTKKQKERFAELQEATAKVRREREALEFR